MKLPNFLIVGAAKAGTTSLYYYLREHPEIYLPEVKELRFFSAMPGNFRGPGDERVNKTIIKSLEEYKLHYIHVNHEIAIGDVSPDYLYFYKNSIPRIKKILKDPKIIIILRNPIERAFSQYLHFVRDGREKLSFEEALKAEEQRREQNWEWAWYYKDVGFYYKQVKAFLENFSEVKIYLYEDFKRNPLNIIQDLYKFLGVDISFVPSNIGLRYNVSGIPRNKILHYFLTQNNILKSSIKPFIKALIPKHTRRKILEKILQKNLVKPQMKPETREYLKELYKDDILKLQELIKRDLSHWLK